MIIVTFGSEIIRLPEKTHQVDDSILKDSFYCYWAVQAYEFISEMAEKE